MKRRLFNILSAVSLLVAVGYAIIWICGVYGFYRSSFYAFESAEAKAAGVQLHPFPEFLVPLAKVELFGCILPAVWLIERRMRQSKALNGCCLVCGYDLRATPERCPECGTAPAKTNQTSN